MSPLLYDNSVTIIYLHSFSEEEEGTARFGRASALYVLQEKEVRRQAMTFTLFHDFRDFVTGHFGWRNCVSHHFS
jgi:hypothetical protein